MGDNKTNSLVVINEEFYSEISSIIEHGRQQAYSAVGQVSIMTFWKIGKRIVEEEQQGEKRAEYGSRLIEGLSERLQKKYGSGYGRRNLAYYRRLYLMFQDWEILHTRVQNLSWSHVRRLLSVSSQEAREWYLDTAAKEMWSVATLDRNVSTQYYERRLAAQIPASATDVARTDKSSPLEYIKNPMVAEFMGFRQNTVYNETEFEQALIDNLEKFILELGRGFAFVERQQHIVTDTADFFIDLVFYNFKMKRFVIFELKTHKLTHQDIGQLDMYVRMYDDLVKEKDDRPTIGVLLCTDTDNTIARYSVLHESEQIFATKYMAYLPTEEELKQEIEQQKQFLLEQYGLSESKNE